MALINRISRLFKADFNAVLDQVEEPELLLRQAIREMEDELAASEQRIRVMTHEKETLSPRLDELDSSVSEIDAELDLCFASKKDDLARGLIRKKIEAQRLSKRVQSKIQALDKQIGELQASLQENRSTLDGLRQKAELFAQQTPASPADRTDEFTWGERQFNVSEDEVEIAYLREKDRRAS